MIPFATFSTVKTFKYTPENKLEDLEGSLQEIGWRVKDRAQALGEIEKPDGLIEIVRED